LNLQQETLQILFRHPFSNDCGDPVNTLLPFIAIGQEGRLKSPVD